MSHIYKHSTSRRRWFGLDDGAIVLVLVAGVRREALCRGLQKVRCERRDRFPTLKTDGDDSEECLRRLGSYFDVLLFIAVRVHCRVHIVQNYLIL